MDRTEMWNRALGCPRCSEAPLVPTGDGFECRACAERFPLIDGIPWLFPEPLSALRDWQSRFNTTLQTLMQEHRQLSDRAREAGLSPRTRRRLAVLSEAKRDHAERLSALLAPVQLPAPTAALETSLAFRTRLPSDQGLMTYAYNVFRDWSWGQNENEASLEIVRRALGDHAPRRVLIVGAGSGRLAYDLHGAAAVEQTVVFDFNPFLLLLARRLTEGKRVSLYEFPLSPRKLDQCAVLREMSAPAPAGPGLHYVLGDALHAPFAPGSFDTVVTPWLIDIVPERFEHLCRRINGLLAAGGRWINFGSLHFHVADPALQYTMEECSDIIGDTGFEPPEMFDTEIPYLCSPASRHGRVELVLSWAARKQSDVPRPPPHTTYPDWITHGNRPVPLLDAFRQRAHSTRVRGYFLSLIDGRRSLDDLARVFADQNLMSFDEAAAAIRASLMKLYDEQRRP